MSIFLFILRNNRIWLSKRRWRFWWFWTCLIVSHRCCYGNIYEHFGISSAEGTWGQRLILDAFSHDNDDDDAAAEGCEIGSWLYCSDLKTGKRLVDLHRESLMNDSIIYNVAIHKQLPGCVEGYSSIVLLLHCFNEVTGVARIWQKLIENTLGKYTVKRLHNGWHLLHERKGVYRYTGRMICLPFYNPSPTSPTIYQLLQAHPKNSSILLQMKLCLLMAEWLLDGRGQDIETFGFLISYFFQRLNGY